MINIPDAERVIEDLSGLFPVVNTALEQGAFQTREYFKSQNKTIDKFLAPNIVRYHAKMILEGDGRKVFEENVKFDLDQIANNGLCLRYDQYWIRILKSAKGELPTAGHSKTKQRFYSQGQNFFKFSSSGETKEKNINLLLLWETDSLYNLKSLALACPKAVDAITESVEIYWRNEVPERYLYAAPAPTETREPNTEELNLVIKQPIFQKKVDLK